MAIVDGLVFERPPSDPDHHPMQCSRTCSPVLGLCLPMHTQTVELRHACMRALAQAHAL